MCKADGGRDRVDVSARHFEVGVGLTSLVMPRFFQQFVGINVSDTLSPSNLSV